VRHGQPANIQIHLNLEGEEVLLCVRDDGRGMHQLPELYAQQGFGLANMRERAETLGGRWELQSEPGAGTRVSVRMPRGKARS
jgi:signal transduction histidine kinase